MTERKLESYIGIKKEIKQLEGYIAEGAPVAADVVQSSAEWPYSPHNVVVVGSDVKLFDKWTERLKKNKAIKAEIESFIEAVPNETLRLTMRYKYFDGLPWQTIAMRCGVCDKDTPHNWVKKYLSNSPNSPKPPV